MPWDAILPSRMPFETTSLEGKLLNRMKTLTNDLQREAADYEVPSHVQAVAYKTHGISARTGRPIKRRGKRIIAYRRTGTLKKSWSHRVGYGLISRALVGEVRSSGNVAPYNKWVRDPAKQTRVMQRLGWQTTEAIMSRHWPKARRDFQAIIKSGR